MSPKANKRAYVETYGCQMNISDGELMEGILEDRGYQIVASPEEADVVLVNTCAIREHAEQRVLGRVAQLNGLKQERPDMVLGVTGCMAQRMGESLLERAPYVDLVMGPDGYRDLPQTLARIESAASGEAPGEAPTKNATVERPRKKGRGPQLAVLQLDMDENYQGLEQRRTEGPTAWVPIQRGCDHRCTYCIVPYVRGGEKNRSAVEIVDEVRRLADGGVSEVTLLGQTVNSWVWEDVSFAQLLRRVARVDGIRRVRYTSPHPNDVTPELVAAMAEEPEICRQLHLPAQAGNNRTLKRMLRRYTVESLLEKIEMVREAMPDIALSTDIIVAFPGETDEEFRDTLELMRTVRFDDAFTYKYSPREGTPATRLPPEDFIDPDVAQARLEELIEVSRGIQAEINASEVGRVEEALIEGEGRDPGQIRGRTERNKVVVFDGLPHRVGEYTHVVLEHTTGATFSGSEVAAPVTAGV
ncbi:MAG: tRNA (N6-isopentenyl adenosine(37)-C2)-methylthiotransferase MiaB [Longimicrobiales bacterium]|nr:tRNA (N6-isopentenyl adenosine(37)-C2)-methylthiotransferase MiaB [Longimicrobiales bacterium]